MLALLELFCLVFCLILGLSICAITGLAALKVFVFIWHYTIRPKAFETAISADILYEAEIYTHTGEDNDGMY